MIDQARPVQIKGSTLMSNPVGVRCFLKLRVPIIERIINIRIRSRVPGYFLKKKPGLEDVIRLSVDGTQVESPVFAGNLIETIGIFPRFCTNTVVGDPFLEEFRFLTRTPK